MTRDLQPAIQPAEPSISWSSFENGPVVARYEDENPLGVRLERRCALGVRAAKPLRSREWRRRRSRRRKPDAERPAIPSPAPSPTDAAASNPSSESGIFCRLVTVLSAPNRKLPQVPGSRTATWAPLRPAKPTSPRARPRMPDPRSADSADRLSRTSEGLVGVSCGISCSISSRELLGATCSLRVTYLGRPLTTSRGWKPWLSRLNL